MRAARPTTRGPEEQQIQSIREEQQVDITTPQRGTSARYVSTGDRIMTRQSRLAAVVRTIANAGNFGPLSLGWETPDGEKGADTYYPSEAVTVLAALSGTA